MSTTTQSTGGGIGVSGLLGVAFVVLKLCHVIDWEWTWVLAPFWLPVAIGLGFLAVVLLVCLVVFILAAIVK